MIQITCDEQIFMLLVKVIYRHTPVELAQFFNLYSQTSAVLLHSVKVNDAKVNFSIQAVLADEEVSKVQIPNM